MIYTLYKTRIAARNGAPDETYLVPTEKGVKGFTQEMYVGKIENIRDILKNSPELDQLLVPPVPQSLPIEAVKNGKTHEQPELSDDLYIVLSDGTKYFYCGMIEDIKRH